MPNRLADATSPYLRQHADNPVDWHPWGPDALQRARSEDRPILLSVGYAACHWCHVMAHESFEDEATAALMNRWFVNVKVDREERPDLDEVYMRAVQALSGGHGGWPMTVFLRPDGRPFFGGTYFPDAPRHGMPSFRQVLERVERLWREQRDEVDAMSERLAVYLDRTNRTPEPSSPPTDAWLEAVTHAADSDFDPAHGGFGTAPKFPPHGLLAALLCHARTTGHPRSRTMACHTLDNMAKGGMYDLLGGGFARYSVDDEWRVPHFEKMLYDNAQLVPVYLDAWKFTGNAHYVRIVEQTIAYLLREMRLPEGGFAASQDADSEGEEGRFFVWTPAQLREVLGTLDGALCCGLLQVSDVGTFEHGTSVLRLEDAPEDLQDEHRALLDAALPKLFHARSRRIPPGRDDKVVTAWNALTVSALARSAAAFERGDWLDAALTAGRFLEERLVVGGRLQRTYKDGRAHVPAFADDHAAWVLGALDLYEATFDAMWLERANHWADTLVDGFWDDSEGGLFTTGHDAETLVTRPKRWIAGAEPTGNGLAALAFTRLSALCGRRDLGERADALLSTYAALLDRAPRALGVEAIAGAWRSQGGIEIGIAGHAQEWTPLLQEVRSRYLPYSVISAVAPQAGEVRWPWMDVGFPVEGPAVAQVCLGRTCRLPVSDPLALGAELDALVEPRPSLRPTPDRVRAPALPTDPLLWLGEDGVPDTANKIVVLDFWTHCCINCLHVLPELDAVAARFRDAPLVVVGVHTPKFTAERDVEAVRAAMERHRIRHPILRDVRHELWRALAIRSWPTLVVLDTEGRVAWQRSGEVHRDELAEVVEALLPGVRTSSSEPPIAEAPIATDHALRYPGNVHVSEDHVYVADSGNGRVVELVLREGSDGWPEAQWCRAFAGFHCPQGLYRLANRLFVADAEGHRLCAVDLTTGSVSTLAGTGGLGRGGSADPHRPTETALRSPWGVTALDTPRGAVVFVSMAGTHQVWLYLTETGEFAPFAGSGVEDHVDGPLPRAAFAQPSGLSLAGRFLFVADSEVSSIRAIDFERQEVVTLVGRGLFDFGDVDGAGEEVLLQHPLDVAVAGDEIYVADTYNHKVKVIGLDRGARTLAGGDRDVLDEPGGLDVWRGYVLVADTNHHRIRAVHRETGEIRDVELRG